MWGASLRLDWWVALGQGYTAVGMPRQKIKGASTDYAVPTNATIDGAISPGQ